ncbi:hypothetical protein [Deinococcus altitudinis]|uniref:hypothetical protein n=1 Tax=Deinococcus altitudinis TaxID=468914 RepID=UPI003891EAB9
MDLAIGNLPQVVWDGSKDDVASPGLRQTKPPQPTRVPAAVSHLIEQSSMTTLQDVLSDLSTGRLQIVDLTAPFANTATFRTETISAFTENGPCGENCPDPERVNSRNRHQPRHRPSGTTLCSEAARNGVEASLGTPE